MKRQSLVPVCCQWVILLLGWHFSPLAAASNHHDSSTTTPSKDGRMGPQNWIKRNVINASTPRPATLFDPTSFHLGFDPTEIDADFDPDFISRREPVPPANNNNEVPDSAFVDNNQNEQKQPKLPHSPVIYRYYGKSRSRTRASGAIPFILLGPNVDHWRVTGEHLAARGFSVIACEQDPIEPEEGEDGAVDNNEHTNNEEWWKGTDGEGANMVLNLLQKSRWTKAILVACDSEAVLAIQAAVGLAPDKIAGLVLVGDLKEVDALLEESHPDLCQQHGNFAVDALLHQILPCPYAIAWDGESAALATPSQYDGSSPAECLQGNRCFILGGGVAPHRRQPETFAWTLTRFVEDKVAPSIPMAKKRNLFGEVNKGRKGGGNVDGVSSPRAPRLPKRLKRFISADYFSSEAIVVYGRVIASALLYASMLKVGIFQYARFLDGMVNMKNQYDTLQNLKKRCLEVLSGFLLNFGYIPLLFRRKRDKPELDPADYVTELEPDPKLEETEETPSEDDNDKSGENENADEESQKEETGDNQSGEEAGDNQSGGETEDESAPSEDTPKDNEPEEEEETRHRFRPIFFLDRVVALADPTPNKDSSDRWSC